MARRNTINDEDRRQWINSDEGLYCLWQSSGLPMQRFIRENREDLDRAIRNVTEGRKPAHYLRYGG